MEKLSKWDYLIVGFILLLTIIPDPTDLADGGLPLVEPMLAFAYWFIRTRMGGKK